LDSWNERSSKFAALFAEDGNIVGFDDSMMKWRIALFQNTPAQFHGRPELVQQLTEQLRQLL
jgi:hypothetical protein